MIYLFLCYHMHSSWRYPRWYSTFTLLLCFHRHFTCRHSWRSSRFFFGICTFGYGVWCWCCLVGYRCVIGALTWSGLTDTSCLSCYCTLCLFVDCCSEAFGMMSDCSDKLLNNLLYLSFIVANGAFGLGFCNASTKFCADIVAASADDTISILTFWGENYTLSEILSDLVSVTNTL